MCLPCPEETALYFVGPHSELSPGMTQAAAAQQCGLLEEATEWVWRSLKGFQAQEEEVFRSHTEVWPAIQKHKHTSLDVQMLLLLLLHFYPVCHSLHIKRFYSCIISQYESDICRKTYL